MALSYGCTLFSTFFVTRVFQAATNQTIGKSLPRKLSKVCPMRSCQVDLSCKPCQRLAEVTSGRRARWLVGVAWLISFILSIPIAILFHVRPVQGSSQCWIEFEQPWQWQLYMSLVALALFVIPALIISICYILIITTIWAKSKLYSKTAFTFQFVAPRPEERVSAVPGQCEDTRRASSRGIIPKAKVKSVKMTFIIVLAFVLCWSPYIVFDLLQVYGYIPRTQNYIAVATLIQSLAPLNSAANPIIYCIFRTGSTNR